jgi:hypothetical protein
VVNCFAYLVTSFTGILWPQYEPVISNWLFPMFGEVAVMLRLIIIGAKVKQSIATAA